MLGLWLIFMIMVFVAEPLLHERFEQKARSHPAASSRSMSLVHMSCLRSPH